MFNIKVNILLFAFLTMFSLSTLQSKVVVLENSNGLKIQVNELSPAMVSIDSLKVITFSNANEYIDRKSVV